MKFPKYQYIKGEFQNANSKRDFKYQMNFYSCP